jgi:hypothetical protein
VVTGTAALSANFPPYAHRALVVTPRRPGYGAKHDRLRKSWAAKVKFGGVLCSRCEKVIDRDEPWDLGHDDKDRTRYTGPEHVACNRSAGARSRGRRPASAAMNGAAGAAPFTGPDGQPWSRKWF